MRIAIDTGGTFTDCVFIRKGRLEILKVLSTPANPAEAILSALRQVDPGPRVEIRHGTTVGTNTLLERSGARVALVTTRGFEDVIFQQRMMGMTAGLTRSEVTDYSRRSVPDPLCPPWRVHGIRARADHMNLGAATVLLHRTDTGREKVWHPQVGPNPSAPGGLLVFASGMLRCPGAPNAYFAVRDPTTGRWSPRVNVRTGCSTL